MCTCLALSEWWIRPIIMKFLKWQIYENIQEICVYLRNMFEHILFFNNLIIFDFEDSSIWLLLYLIYLNFTIFLTPFVRTFKLFFIFCSFFTDHTIRSYLAFHSVCLMVFNVTFNNISVISWRSVLLVEETGGPGENHRPVASQW